MSLFTVNSNGVITVDTSEIKETFQEAYKNALGSNLNLDASTPQGQLIQSETAVVEEIQTDLVTLVNTFNVYTAEGEGLDSAGAFFGYYRKTNQPTVVVATITGQPDTEIPAGSRASNGNEDFETLDTVVIPAGGTAQVEFQCVKTGAIPCVAGSLNTIVDVITGWDTVENEFDGVIGYETETDNEFRSRITANWLNIRAISTLGSIIDNIAQLDGVVSVVGRENVSGSTKIIDGLSLKEHSIWLTILGGKSGDIAKILTEKKSLGCDTNGTTQVEYYDENVGYTYTYNIKRPDVETLYIQVNYEANAYTPEDATDTLKELVRDFVANNPIKIGQKITGNWLATAFDSYNKINLLSIKVRLDSSDAWSDYVSLGLDKVASIEDIDIEEV